MRTSTTQVSTEVPFFKAAAKIRTVAALSGTRCRKPLHHRVQSIAVDLAIRVARNVRHIDEPYGNKRLRELLAAMLLQGLLVQPAVRHDECPDLVDAEPIRHAERRRIADAIERPERASSIVRRLTLSPPRFTISFLRPLMTSMLSSVRYPISPVSKYPSRMPFLFAPDGQDSDSR